MLGISWVVYTIAFPSLRLIETLLKLGVSTHSVVCRVSGEEPDQSHNNLVFTSAPT